MKCPVDCKMTRWSAFGKCTKECEGGTQSRTRNVARKPKNGGASCLPPTETQPCNTGSCDRDCKLKRWTKWSPCSQACSADGKSFGFRETFRHVKIPTRGKGKCPKKESKRRYREVKCNKRLCRGDEKCISRMDLIVAIDSSGSLKTA